MPNTRSTRARFSSASQSQSQSQSRTRKRKDAQTRDGLPPVQESFASASTASLPPNHTIHIALPLGTDLTRDQELAYHVNGQELLADGWKREEIEGKLPDLRAARSRLRNEPVKVSALPVANRPLWYSAELRYPRTSDLRPLSSSWSFAVVPPTAVDLPILSSDASQTVLVGDTLPQWNSKASVDLDPDLDTLPDFAHSWMRLSPPPLPVQLDPLSSPKSAMTIVEDPTESFEARRIRKGKFKAEVSVHSSLTFVSSSPIAKAKDDGDSRVRRKDYALLARQPLQTSQSPNVLVPTSSEDEQQERSKRKAWWRTQFRSDEGYGRFWKVIPRPHTLDYHPPAKPPKRKKSDPRVPDFVLPKFYSSSMPHPFNPNLIRWISENPRERVCWIIPIHGPVHIPHYIDTSTSPPSSAPVPSCATLHLAQTKSALQPKDLSWSDPLLKHFWTAFLVPLQSDQTRSFGDISIRLSGPKPDPFIDFPPQARLASSSPPSVWTGPQVEVGDHMRVYLDAKFALRFRTWLRGVEVDPRSLGNGVSDEELIRPFFKVRLVLLTLSGQALIAA